MLQRGEKNIFRIFRKPDFFFSFCNEHHRKVQLTETGDERAHMKPYLFWCLRPLTSKPPVHTHYVVSRKPDFDNLAPGTPSDVAVVENLIMRLLLSNGM